MHRRWFMVGSVFAMLLGVVSLPQAQPKAGGTLRIAHPGDMTFFNAHQGPAPGYNTLWVWNNIFNSLLTMTPPPELKVVPELAQSWEVLDEGKTYVFHLMQGVKFHDGTDFDATTALRTGEIDFVSRVPVKLVPLLEKFPKVKVLTGPEMGPTVAFLNMRVKPFDDVRGRRAVGGFGIDRAEIAKVAFQGRTKPLVSVLPPGVQGAIDLNELYPYNPDKAKQMLKELGFDEKNPLQLSILVGNHDATLADIATLVKNQMAKIGVDAKINLLDATAVVDRVLVKHDFEMVVSGWGSLIDINMRSVSFFKGMQSDYMGIDDPKLEAMVYQWRASLEPAARDRISADMQRLIAEQLYWVNVTGAPLFQAARDHVKDFPFYDQAYFFMEKVWLEK